MSQINGPPPDGGGRLWPHICRARPPGERLQVWQALPGKTWRFAISGPLQPTFTHWTGFRTIACVGRHRQCRWCADQRPRFKGYLGASALQSHPPLKWDRGRCLVELPASACLDAPRLRLPLDAVQGRRLDVWRVDARHNARVTCRIDDQPLEVPWDRRKVDPKQGLRRLWTQGPHCVPLQVLDEVFAEWSTIIMFEE